jgi:hypothetical protein
MITVRRNIRRSGWGILLALLSLFVLHWGVLARASTTPAPDHAAVLSIEFCAQGAATGEERAPLRHSDCDRCLICQTAGVPAPVDVVVAIATSGVSDPASGERRSAPRDEPPPPIPGWTTAWSSQSPPKVS